MFVSRGDGTLPVGSTWPLTTVKAIQRRAGVVTLDGNSEARAKRTFHEHRHTAATVMLTAHKALPVVARQLGHASSQITALVYEHLLDDALLDGALEAFEAPRVARTLPDALPGTDEGIGERAQPRM